MLLPIAPFTETAGTFINAEGRIQSFHAVVKPLGETRPAWKVLRVLGNLLHCQGLILILPKDVMAQLYPNGVPEMVPTASMGNACDAPVDLSECTVQLCAASIYQLDGFGASGDIVAVDG